MESLDNPTAYRMGLVLLGVGSTFVLSSFFALGFTGTFLGKTLRAGGPVAHRCPLGPGGGGAWLVCCSAPKSKALGPLLLQAPACPWLAGEACLSHLASWLSGQVTLPFAALGTQARAGAGLERVWVEGMLLSLLCVPHSLWLRGFWAPVLMTSATCPRRSAAGGGCQSKAILGTGTERRREPRKGAQQTGAHGRCPSLRWAGSGLPGSSLLSAPGQLH